MILRPDAMRRRLFKFAFIFSAVLTIGLSILCIRSLWIADAWGWSYGKRSWQCGFYRFAWPRANFLTFGFFDPRG